MEQKALEVLLRAKRLTYAGKGAEKKKKTSPRTLGAA